MGRASRLKKEKRSVNVSAEARTKIDRDIRRAMGIALTPKGQEYVIQDFREWPCSMSNGKALLPINITPYKKDDGKLYFKVDDKEIMVVCQNYILKTQAEAIKKAAEENSRLEDSVCSLKPAQLGE